MSASEAGSFDRPRATFESLVAVPEDEDARGLSHADLEKRLEVDGRELVRQLLQSHLDLRALRERRAGSR
jgi:outer membrane protein TolC